MRPLTACSSKLIHVKTRAEVGGDGHRMLAAELIKHLLYMRNQVPSLYEDLEWQVQQLLYDEQLRKEAAHTALIGDEGIMAASHDTHTAQRKGKRRLQTSQKRLCKFFAAAENMLETIGPECFISQQPVQLVLAFGSTPSRPLELYSLTLPPADQNANAAEHTAVEDLVRRSIRSLVVNTQDLPDGKAASGPTKLFVLLYGKYEAAPPGFAYKRGFTIRMRKGLQVHIKLAGVPCQTEDVADYQPEFLTPGEHSDMQWYQCQVVLRGLRTPGSNEIDRS